MEQATIKAVIIDDEPGSRNNLKLLLAQYCPEVMVIGMGKDVITGLEAINTHCPDVVFLDIEMPKYNGFKLVQLLSEKCQPEIIFTTAYEQYAIQAFKVSAVDFLLKPINIDGLIASVQKVVHKKNIAKRERFLALQSNLQTPNSKIAVPHHDGFSILETKQVVCIEAKRSYALFHLSDDNRIMASKPLKDFEDMLGSPVFFRPHRSYLINMQHVREYQKKEGGQIKLSNGLWVPLARSKKEAFIDFYRAYL